MNRFLSDILYADKIYCSTNIPITTLNPKKKLKWWRWQTWHRKSNDSLNVENNIIEYQMSFSMN